jgi:hypothetical protein
LTRSWFQEETVRPRAPKLIAPYYPVAKHGGVASVSCYRRIEAGEVSSYSDEFASREEFEHMNNYKEGETFFDCDAEFQDGDAFLLTVIVGRAGESWRPIRVG